ncbi:hypothetical protein I317_02494 [Kwoniella heveanensis CBS 569]|uniref:Mitochondrial outer membrane protein OM14 C-terminal domain-containing protein n=1 Tax=Kwoniella heveanensis BCC8398 TaxID=1296120 RepID=A0A1B9GRN7_9TREE|nr:hypothetical protein I316_04760 [Kwoniella heveanensis BCC8398]OCF43603.1 hypothetical protein I317_02494 [Kwoniella heveanensis CBS 569]
MSYASVASHNIPFGEMPQPDQHLREGGHFEGETEATAAVDSKVNVLPAGSDPNHPDIETAPVSQPISVELHPAADPEPSTSEAAPKPLPTPTKSSVDLPESGAEYEKKAKETEKKAKETEKKVESKAKQAEKKVEGAAKDVEKKAEGLAKDAEKKGKELSKKAQNELHKAESALGPYWDKTKDVVLRPGTLGGLMGVVNVGILGTLGYFAYTRKDQPWDRRIVGGAVAGTLALFGAEGYVAESYLQTPEGREEAERAKAEGSKFYLQAKEVILRPQVAGGLVGAVNVAILGALGYFSYKNWNQPWDRRTVSAISVGLLGLSGLEGYAGKVYKDKELPKH